MPEYQPCSEQRTETYIILTIVQKCPEIPGYDVKILYGSDHKNKNKNKKTKLRSCRCDTNPPPYPGQLYSITATPQRVDHNNLNGYSLSLPSTPSLLNCTTPITDPAQLTPPIMPAAAPLAEDARPTLRRDAGTSL